MLSFRFTEQTSENVVDTTFKIKIKQNLGCSSKEYNANFNCIHQNIRAYPRSNTKSALINDWKNIAYWGESEKSEPLANKFIPNNLFQI